MISSRPSEYFGWYFRYNTRTTYGRFTDAGLNLFASPAAQTQEDWLDLTNVLPAISGGFRRRWGIASVLNSITTGASNPSFSVMNPVRTIAYNAPQDTSNPTGTQATNWLVMTDGAFVSAINDTGTTFATLANPFITQVTGSYPTWSVVSRMYLYQTGQSSGFGSTGYKAQLNLTAGPSLSQWGIQYPPSDKANAGSIEIIGYGSGSGYSGSIAISSVTDDTGTGSGATGGAILSNGRVSGGYITAAGTGYVQPHPHVPAPGTGSDQAWMLGYTDLNTANSTYGKLITMVPAGPMQFVAGRTYTFALMNSTTGHVSDLSATTATTPGNQTIPNITDAVLSQPWQWGPDLLPATPGWTGVDVKITLGPNIDPQVDTVLLLATSDGGSLENLYLVASIPLSSFTGSPKTYTYADTTPDTYSAMYMTGATLTTNDVYQSTDGFGDNYGIVGNLPPSGSMLYPVLHQGRIFGTDGRTVFYSKSIDEVTTSTGLITSKWEEAWPADNQLPIGFTNETVTALFSDGTNLHIGTTKNIYTLYGTDASSFTVPNAQFAVGVLSNDLVSVVYAGGQPVGFVWITPDYKVMWSDFNTYVDIGTQVYPLLTQWDSTFTTRAKVLSLTQGPYTFAILTYKRTTSASAEFLIFETGMRKWYRWEFGSPNGFLQPEETGPLCSFVYQHPSTGARYLYFFTMDSNVAQATRIYTTGVPSGYTLNLYRFDPALLVDVGSTGIGWNVQTTWQYMDDPQVVKVLNEIDLISDESGLYGTVYGAFTEADFDSPLTLYNGVVQTGILGNTKIYLAGGNTRARYYSYRFYSNAPSLTTDEVLTTFTVEHCPISRI